MKEDTVKALLNAANSQIALNKNLLYAAQELQTAMTNIENEMSVIQTRINEIAGRFNQTGKITDAKTGST